MATDDPAARWPHYREDDFIIRNFAFKSGEVLPELRLHYRTMGVPRRDASGTIVNGVLLLQGNTGTGPVHTRPRGRAARPAAQRCPGLQARGIRLRFGHGIRGGLRSRCDAPQADRRDRALVR